MKQIKSVQQDLQSKVLLDSCKNLGVQINKEIAVIPVEVLQT